MFRKNREEIRALSAFAEKATPPVADATGGVALRDRQ
jgi:hypothetical protein